MNLITAITLNHRMKSLGKLYQLVLMILLRKYWGKIVKIFSILVYYNDINSEKITLFF